MSTKLQPLEPVMRVCRHPTACRLTDLRSKRRARRADGQPSLREKISDSVTRILGQNPGRFTLQGTNTYLIGRSSPYVLLDTGEGKAAYLPQLADALGTGSLSAIIISHEHRDHWGGLASTLALLRERGDPRPTVYKWRNVAYDGAIVEALLADSFVTSANGDALHPLTEGQVRRPTVSSLL
jgi:ribonuclease/clavin/mitogillin